MLNVLMHSDELANSEYNPSHPFKPVRAKILLELLHRYSLIYEKNQKITEPKPLQEETLYLFHDRNYIELLKKGEKGEFTIEMLHAGLGTGDNPLFKSMYQLSLLATGGTYSGAMMLFNNEARFVFNPIGGFHHAGSDHAEGFCYINDIAVTITDLIRKGQRIAYIDIDAHHGNGVQNAFYDSNQVLTISLHESGETLYPGSGFENEMGIQEGRGYNVNVPLREETDDEVYLFAFESIVPPLIENFKPDIVFAEIGCDTHKDDPLAHLNLTSNGYKTIIGIINRISPKILAMGAGGYNIYKTAALWTLAWATFCGIKPVDQHTGTIGGMMYGPDADRLDDPLFILNGIDKELCFAQARKVVQFVKENIFPIHRI